VTVLERGREEDIGEFADSIAREEISCAGVRRSGREAVILKVRGLVESQGAGDHHGVARRRDLWERWLGGHYVG
jgi:hypothetical protein